MMIKTLFDLLVLTYLVWVCWFIRAIMLRPLDTIEGLLRLALNRKEGEV